MSEILLYANPEMSADLLFWSGFSAPDPYLGFTDKGRKVGLMNPLEIGRAQQENAFDVLYSTQEVSAQLGQKNASLADQVAFLAKKHGLISFRVASDFPCGLFQALQQRGLALEISTECLFPERLQKTEAQQAHIEQANKVIAKAFDRVAHILRESEIRGESLNYHGRPLTSEYIRGEIELLCMQEGALAQRTIVACGDQATDPHCQGSGILKANELIIVDIFPRMKTSHYYGDMTRTFLKGQGTQAQSKLVHTVQKAHKKAIEALKAGVSLKKIHETVMTFFEKEGYETVTEGTQPKGFFHGTGHGLGLEIHEPLRINAHDDSLAKEGMVLTVEPGLYYRGLGGVRIEDVLAVTHNGSRYLSHYGYDWKIA